MLEAEGVAEGAGPLGMTAAGVFLTKKGKSCSLERYSCDKSPWLVSVSCLKKKRRGIAVKPPRGTQNRQ